MTDDGIRERHGMHCREPGIGPAHVTLIEDEHLIIVARFSGDRSLTPTQARYLARKLYRLARRIDNRQQEQE